MYHPLPICIDTQLPHKYEISSVPRTYEGMTFNILESVTCHHRKKISLGDYYMPSMEKLSIISVVFTSDFFSLIYFLNPVFVFIFWPCYELFPVAAARSHGVTLLYGGLVYPPLSQYKVLQHQHSASQTPFSFYFFLCSPPPLAPQIVHSPKEATIAEVSPDSLPFHSKNGTL